MERRLVRLDFQHPHTLLQGGIQQGQQLGPRAGHRSTCTDTSQPVDLSLWWSCGPQANYGGGGPWPWNPALTILIELGECRPAGSQLWIDCLQENRPRVLVIAEFDHLVPRHRDTLQRRRVAGGSGQDQGQGATPPPLTVLLPSASLSSMAGRLVPLLLACMGHNRIWSCGNP